MSVQARLRAFTKARLQPRDTREVNLLNSSLAAWFRYYDFLIIIRNRYEQVRTPYTEALKMQLEETTETGPRSLTREELVVMQNLLQFTPILHLDIDSFYLFANILLDRIASTFRYYFWRKPKWNHWQLVQNIARICEKKPLSVVPDDILTIPIDLQRRIVDYRNRRIEHVEEPRFQFSTTWGSDNKPKIHTMLLYPE
jgi:hypothetical protein